MTACLVAKCSTVSPMQTTISADPGARSASTSSASLRMVRTAGRANVQRVEQGPSFGGGLLDVAASIQA